MKGKIFAVLLAFILAPAMMLAEDTFSQRIAGEACMVEVFHTDFAFPPEGGKIVKIGSRMYFVRDYLPGCQNAGTGTIIKSSSGQTVIPPPATFVAADPCMVPIYHTDFAFPPEGGQIVQIGDQLYFVKNYLPGCQNAGLGYPPVRSSQPMPNGPTGGVPAGGRCY